MKHHLLTTRGVADIVASARRGYYADGAGLYLQISVLGTASWIFRFQQDNKVRDMGLGSAKLISLTQARRLTSEFREQLLRGDDPLEIRLAKREQTRADRERRHAEKRERLTFRDAARQFIALHSPHWDNDVHRKQWNATLETYAFPKLGHLPVTVIVGEDITQALAPIWLTKVETAKRTKGRIERILLWAKSGMPLPQQGASKRVKHHKALPFVELPSFMDKLRERDCLSARALELTILTALRTSEVIGATWPEIDLKAKTWTVPAERMKLRKEHVVPLSPRAVEILKALPRVSDYVFPGAKGGTMSNMSMLELLRGMSGNGYTVHGFRSAFRDWSGDRTSFSHEVCEFALAHGIPDKAQAAYRRYRSIDKRRQLMDAWAGFCESPATTATVTPIRRAK